MSTNRLSTLAGSQNIGSTSSTLSSSASSAAKTRQITHLHAQLAQLTAHMSDLESIMRMTSEQARDVRDLGGYIGALFMAAGKVFDEKKPVMNEEQSEII